MRFAASTGVSPRATRARATRRAHTDIFGGRRRACCGHAHMGVPCTRTSAHCLPACVVHGLRATPLRSCAAVTSLHRGRARVTNSRAGE